MRKIAIILALILTLSVVLVACSEEKTNAKDDGKDTKTTERATVTDTDNGAKTDTEEATEKETGSETEADTDALSPTGILDGVWVYEDDENSKLIFENGVLTMTNIAKGTYSVDGNVISVENEVGEATMTIDDNVITYEGMVFKPTEDGTWRCVGENGVIYEMEFNDDNVFVSSTSIVETYVISGNTITAVYNGGDPTESTFELDGDRLTIVDSRGEVRKLVRA